MRIMKCRIISCHLMSCRIISRLVMLIQQRVPDRGSPQFPRNAHGGIACGKFGSTLTVDKLAAPPVPGRALLRILVEVLQAVEVVLRVGSGLRRQT